MAKKREPKQEADYAALQSPLMRIPHIDVATVRDLMDIGMAEIYELSGRAPEVLFEELKRTKPRTPADRLLVLRMAVYYAEHNDPDPELMYPWRWKD